MDMKGYACIAAMLLVLTLLPAPASATSDCPASASTIGAYRKLIMEPRFKLVNEPFTIEVVKVEKVNNVEQITSVATTVTIELMDGLKVVEDWRFTKSRNSIVTFIPETAGKYRIKTTVTNPATITVYARYIEPGEAGTSCGNEECESGETPDNCPEDCVICGDGFCEGDEDKGSCPEDCMICGDGICDDSEIGATECYCEIDCIVCGDGICRESYGETDCPADCPHQAVETGGDGLDLLAEYWWLIAIIAVAAVLVLMRGRLPSLYGPVLAKLKRKGKKKYAKSTAKSGKGWIKEERSEAKAKQTEAAKEEEKEETEEEAKKLKEREEAAIDDEEIEEIISELLDTGVSERQIKRKLKDFGLEGDEIDDLLEKAKRIRET